MGKIGGRGTDSAVGAKSRGRREAFACFFAGYDPSIGWSPPSGGLVGRQLSELPSEPRPGDPQVVPDDVDRTAGGIGDFFGGHSPEIVQLDDLRQWLVLTLERFQRAVEGEQTHLL